MSYDKKLEDQHSHSSPNSRPQSKVLHMIFQMKQ